MGCLPALLLAGCGQSSNSPTANSPAAVSEDGDGDSAENPPKPNDELQALLQDKQATPDAIVKAFLDAAKSSDREFAEQLLTKAARKETEREGLVIDPPGTPEMTFEVAGVEFDEENPSASYVKVRWFEASSDVDSSEIIWVLRKESHGWRIAGMTTPQGDGQFLTWNFEEPADMQEIRRQLSAEPDAWSDNNVTPASGTSELRTHERK
jgi:hypothetical protein